MTTLFVADIHLGTEHPQISEQFVAFLRNEASSAEVLYILGDLFEVWIGDDAVQPEHKAAINALKTLTSSGVPVCVMRGNRDFLMAEGFETLTGCRLLADPTVIDLYGQQTLLMHGDSLCTDDEAYQKFRHQTRTPQWQARFLAMTPEERLAFAHKARQESRSHNQKQPMEIMDVNQATVLKTMREHEVKQLIHGHTHRPAVHVLEIDGQLAHRTVLGDWYTQRSYLRVTGADYELTK